MSGVERLPASKAEAKRLGYKHYFTGKSCYNGHVDKRLVSDGKCSQCACKKSRKWQQDNPSKRNEYTKRWRAANPERARNRRGRNTCKWSAANPELARYCRADSFMWRQKRRQRARESSRAWQKANRGRANYLVRKYQTTRLNATPQWLTDEHQERTRRVYETCPDDHHVDHIVPLNGEGVCGLHVPWNLQHLTAAENLRKGNNYETEENRA